MRPLRLVPFSGVKVFFLLFAAVLVSHCGQAKAEQPITKLSEPVKGYGILARISGQWSGPVMTSTPAGNFPNWYVDFRPVSAGQVSQYTTIDADTLNYLTFFIVKHDGELKVAMRTEGVFQNKGCVTYEVIDKVNEAEGYYRFSDFQAGEKRAYTEFKFGKDSFVMEVYTSKFNKVYPLVIHSKWEAKLGSGKAATDAAKDLAFPQPVMVKDFSGVFKNMPESIYYTFENDPYSSSSQPYVGEVTVNISIDKKLKTDKKHELFLLLTTECLFDGIKYIEENMKFISRYVYLPGGTKTYTFKNVHPGKYYIYSYSDINGDKKHKSGDYMNSDVQNSFILQPEGKIAVNRSIDFVIP